MARRVGTRCLRAAAVLALAVGALPGLLVVGAGPAAAAAASPTVSGPVAGGTPSEFMFSTNFDLAQVGYQEREFFLSGSATAYASATPLTTDGKWTVAPLSGSATPYTTRAIVRRPIDPRRFNGTVVVEWLNVSGLADAGPDWTLAHNELIRDGFAWVGVSAQWQGVQTAQGKNPAVAPGDPARYGTLSHPGDSYSYDIFSQAGQALRDHGSQLLSGLTPRKLVAAGESQSAGRLVTYIDGINPLVHVYDAFLVHSRGATGAALRQLTPGAPPTPATANDVVPAGTKLRDDTSVPVFLFQTETDIFNSNTTARQPDTNLFRAWEVAGSSHFDDYGLAIGPTDTGNGQGAVQNLAAMQNPPSNTSAGNCNLPINTGGTHWVLDAAMAAMQRWVTFGLPPASGAPLQTSSVSPVVFAKDANGNTLGGVRSPQVDAPVATLGGVGNTPAFCVLFGTTVPFSPAQLSTLYPSHAEFVARWTVSSLAAVVKGFLTLPDAIELVHSAAVSDIAK
jgi:hypothetical protein